MIPFLSCSSKTSLFDSLFSGVRAGVKVASGEVLDKTDALCNADLLLLGQLAGETTLTCIWVVDWQRLYASLQKKQC